MLNAENTLPCKRYQIATAVPDERHSRRDEVTPSGHGAVGSPVLFWADVRNGEPRTRLDDEDRRDHRHRDGREQGGDERCGRTRIRGAGSREHDRREGRRREERVGGHRTDSVGQHQRRRPDAAVAHLVEGDRGLIAQILGCVRDHAESLQEFCEDEDGIR
ncbi:hypothetical protein Q9Q99_11160 [Curtobacterium flaccumfaciens]|nr:hypothetical protein Q9Q99_11160 [Curtobacterium flaccumfaciens]